jgi:hypothetical protein
MQIPMTISILALMAVIGALSWLYVGSTRQTAVAYAEMMRVSKEYADQALKIAADTARLQPKYAEKMLDALARSVTDVTKSSSDAMQAIYGPVRMEQQQASVEHDDLPTPWYAEEGAMDYSDPTDSLLVADPVEYADNGGGLDGALLMDGDEEPFGVPGLKAMA